MTLPEYISTRIALARAYYDECDTRYLAAYYAVKRDYLRQVALPRSEDCALLKRQADVTQ